MTKLFSVRHWVAWAYLLGWGEVACGIGPGIQYDPTGDSDFGIGDSAVPPAAPESVTATPGHRQIVVSWAASAGATSYRIYWATSGGVTRHNGLALDAIGSPFPHEGLTNGVAYYYVVTAIGPGGESGESSEVSAIPALLPPTGVSAIGGNGEVTVYWTAVAGATSHNIYWGTSSGVTRSSSDAIGAVTSPYQHPDRVNGTTYYYVVTAVDGGEESDESNEVFATPSLPAPTNLAGIPGEQQVTLQWDPVPGAISYRLYWSTSSDVTPQTGTIILDAVSPYTHLGLIDGTTYWYVVTSIDAASESLPSIPVSVRPGPPDAPAGLSATAGYERVIVTWNASPGATSYNLYWSTSSPVALATAEQIPAVTSPHAHAGLNNGTTYYYVVTAVGPGGESGESTEVSATPALLPPENLVAKGDNGFVTLSWDPAPGATIYTLYWSTAPGVSQTDGSGIGGITSPYLHPGLDNGTTYYYVVTASDGVDESADSIEANATPRLPAPKALSAAPGNELATLSWTEVAGATGFNLYWRSSPGVTTHNGILIPDVNSPYEHAGLTNGIPLYWVVTAFDATDESEISNEATVTPGPRLLAYRIEHSNGQTEVLAVNVSGGVPGVPQPVATSHLQGSFDFSPDGRLLWYHANDPCDLFVKDATSSTLGPAFLVNRPVHTLGVGQVLISPNGHWLAYEADQDVTGSLDLYLSDVTSLPPSSPVRLTVNAAVGSPESMVFSPDSTRLYFRLTAGHLFCVDLADGWAVAKRISEPGSGGGSVAEVQIGRNGIDFAYLGDLDTSGYQELYLGELSIGCTASGGKITTSAEVSDFILSPNDDAIAFLSAGELLVSAATAGAFLTQVNTGGEVTRFAWSRDGRWLAFIGDQDSSGTSQLFSAAMAGETVGTVTKLNGPMTSGGDVIDFVFTRDSQHVVYVADQDMDELRELYLLDVSGSIPSAAQKVNDTLYPSGGVTGFASAFGSDSLIFTAQLDASAAEELFLVDISTGMPGTPERITPPASPGAVIGGLDAAFEHLANAYAFDDTFLLYLADHELLGTPELYLVERTSSAVPQKVNDVLVTGSVGRFRWAPLVWAVREWEP